MQNFIYFCFVTLSSAHLLDTDLSHAASISPRLGPQLPSEMANEGERPTSADKGKGKVDDVRELNGKNSENGEKPVDEKKKDEASPDGTLR